MTRAALTPASLRNYVRARFGLRPGSEESFFIKRHLALETVYRLNRGDSRIDRLVGVAKKLKLSPFILFWIARGNLLRIHHRIRPILIRERTAPELWVTCGAVEIPAPFSNLYGDMDRMLLAAAAVSGGNVPQVLRRNAESYARLRSEGRNWVARGAQRRMFAQADVPVVARALRSLAGTAGFEDLDLVRGLWIFSGHFGLDRNFTPLFDAKGGRLILPGLFEPGVDVMEYPDGSHLAAMSFAQYIGDTFARPYVVPGSAERSEKIQTGEWPGITADSYPIRMSTTEFWRRFEAAIRKDFRVKDLGLKIGRGAEAIGAVVLPERFSNLAVTIGRALQEAKKKRPDRKRDASIIGLIEKYLAADYQTTPLREELLVLAEYLARYHYINKRRVPVSEWFSALLVYANYAGLLDHLPVYRAASERYDVPRHLVGHIVFGEGPAAARPVDTGRAGTVNIVQVLSRDVDDPGAVVKEFGALRILAEISWLSSQFPGQLHIGACLDLIEHIVSMQLQVQDVLCALARFSWARANDFSDPQAIKSGKLFEKLGLSHVTPRTLREAFVKLPPSRINDFMSALALHRERVSAGQAAAEAPSGPAFVDRFPRVFDEEGLIQELERRADAGDERARVLYSHTAPLGISGVDDMQALVRGANFLFALLRDGSLHVATIRGAALLQKLENPLARGQLRVSWRKKNLLAYDGGPAAALPHLAKRIQDFGFAAVSRPGLGREKVVEEDDVEPDRADDFDAGQELQTDAIAQTGLTTTVKL